MTSLCSVCGDETEIIESHHISYSPPLKVNLCRSCHKKIHKKKRIQELTSIKISKSTRELLRLRGQKGETYDEILMNLMERLDNLEKLATLINREGKAKT